ncbi:hypothetical protein H5410_029309 [Solanum commersonii]|uniref:Uncharacterized protein n=1 Tax=Solanum commersonii TaxID=4109 RepID=A0A9J5Z4M0_SOLCO|nr:hypothetical protein H5410_029309 [Solanum commersonii]
MEQVVHHGHNGPFKRSNEPRSRFFGDPKFRRHFCQKITWTSIKTLTMEPVGHHGQNSTRFYGDPEFRRQFCQKFMWTSVKILAMEQVGHHSQNVPFTRLNEPRSNPRDFMVTQKSDVILAKILPRTPLRP